MAQIKIRVGAALDSSALTVFQPLVKAAERARKDIQKSLDSAAKEPDKIRRASKSSGDALIREVERMADKILKDEEKSQRQRTREVEKETKARVRLEKAAAREVERELARSERGSGNGPSRRRRNGGAIGIGFRSGISVSRSTAVAYGLGRSALGSALRGIGVETDMSSMVEQGVANQALAQKIVNSAPEYNSADVGSRQTEATSINAKVNAISNATATNSTDTMEALEAFVAKTGELSTGLDTLKDMATLSRATGTNLLDMSNAAAEVSNNLGDVPDKGKAIYDVMKAVAGQGKLGAVEVKDLASQMAKIASVAGFFEGDRSKNIAILGGMAQEAKLRGGAATATQATTSIQAFVNSLTKGATIKNWRKAVDENGRGLNPYTDKSETTLRSPEELVLEALKYSKGNMEKLAKLFPSSQAMRGVRGYAQIYDQAGGGVAGLDAVRDEFRRLGSAAMTDADVMSAFAAQMSTTQSKVQVFNNEMQQTAMKLETALVPAFEALAPVVVGLAGVFSDVMGTLLGSIRPEEERAAGAADREAQNAAGKTRAFVGSNLIRHTGVEEPGETDVRIAKNLSAAAPIFKGDEEKRAALESALDQQREKVKSEAQYDAEDPTKLMSDEDIKALAKKGNEGATQYLEDKQTLERMQDSQTQLTKSIDSLTAALTSGAFDVKVVKMPPTPPKSDRSGAMPADSEGP